MVGSEAKLGQKRTRSKDSESAVDRGMVVLFSDQVAGVRFRGGGLWEEESSELSSTESFHTPLIFLLRKLVQNGEATGLAYKS